VVTNNEQRKEGKKNWKQKLLHEFIEYWINVAYLAIFFTVFINYRRLILAKYNIEYLNYGIALFEALILAKVIMIGDLLRLGRNFEDKPLIYSTLYRTVVFTIFVTLFKVLEHTVRGLLNGEGLAGGLEEMMSKGKYELLAYLMIIFFVFIPFFAFKELSRVLGKGRISELFFRRKGTFNSELPE
jgi:hypothetical protein